MVRHAHPRNDDTAGLGDWEVNETKLPGGLGPVIARAEERGVRFGLWVEPEMVNPDSTLYAEHPDWVVGQPTRPRREFRQQYVLDALQPAVADFVLDVVDRTLAENPGISYLKWDANRPLTDPGVTRPGSRPAGQLLGRPRAGDLGPDGGGGGAPPRADADAVRVGRRTRRPRVAALVPRGLAVGQHRSRRPGAHAVGRLAFPAGQRRRRPTSPSGEPAHRLRVCGGHERTVRVRRRFRGLTDEELAVCRRAVALYREVRPLVQQGDLWRLLPPGRARRPLLCVPRRRRGRGLRLPTGGPTADAGTALRLVGSTRTGRTTSPRSTSRRPDSNGAVEQWSGADLTERGLRGRSPRPARPDLGSPGQLTLGMTLEEDREALGILQRSLDVLGVAPCVRTR